MDHVARTIIRDAPLMDRTLTLDMLMNLEWWCVQLRYSFTLSQLLAYVEREVIMQNYGLISDAIINHFSKRSLTFFVSCAWAKEN